MSEMLAAIWDFLTTPSWGLIWLVVGMDWGSFALLRYLEGVLARLNARLAEKQGAAS